MNKNIILTIISISTLIILALSGCGANSPTAGSGGTGGTGGTTIPTTPASLSATPGNLQNTLSWTAVTGATSYKIYASTTASTSATLLSSGSVIVATSTPYNHTGLANGTTYYYVVTAVNGIGESSASAVASGTPVAPLALMGGTMQGAGRNLTLAGTVTTFAGVAGFIALPANASYADGIGAAARFYQPYGITTDGTNLYVADSGNHIIRKIVIATQQVTTIAGTASSAGSIDGTGTGAKFNWPLGITTDGTNLYVSDYTNNTIRKIVIATNVVTTLAGTVGVAGSVNGTGTGAQFNGPGAITTDGTNLYVVENTANVIRKVVIATGSVTTIATTPATGTFTCLTTDGTNLYTSNNSAVYKIVIATGQVTLIAGTSGAAANLDGTGAAARFNLISGMTTDGTNLYATDMNNNNVRKIVISTGVVTTVSGLGWFWPRVIVTDGTSLYVAQQYYNCVSKIQ